MGLGTLNHVREQQPYSWPFMNAIDTGWGGGSYFTSPCIQKQRKTQWNLGSELDQKMENRAMQEGQRLHLRAVLKIH